MKKYTAILFISFISISSYSQDRIFNYTYQSTVLNMGQAEMEIWNTLSTGKAEYFRELSNRFEFEIGLGSNLQTAFYFNINTESAYTIQNKLVFENSVVTEKPDTFLSTTSEFSFSNEWKLKLSDPVADAFGAALYAEIQFGTVESELEAKLILDKKFNKFITALNLVGAYEIEKEMENGEVENESEFEAEIVYALAYQLSKSWHIGIEAMNVNGFHEGEVESSVLYAGPTFSYLKDRFWINLTVFPQLTAFKGATVNGLDLDHHTKLETRLLFSYAF